MLVVNNATAAVISAVPIFIGCSPPVANLSCLANSKKVSSLMTPKGCGSDETRSKARAPPANGDIFGRRKQTAVGRPTGRIDVALMATKRLKQLPGLHFPDFHGVISGSRRHFASVDRPVNRKDPRIMRLDQAQRGSENIPKPNRSIEPGGGQCRLISRQANRQDPVGMALQRLQQRASIGIPNLDGLIHRARGNSVFSLLLPPHDRLNHIVVIGERLQEGAAVYVPNPHHSVVPTGRKSPGISRKGDRINPSAGVESPEQFSGPPIPYLDGT